MQIPVQIDVTPTQVCGTCAKCGQAAECAVSTDPSAGTPKERRELATATVLKKLTAECAERLPWGVAPSHVDRRVPRGVRLAVDGRDGKLWELSVNEKGKLETVVGGCAFTADVLVIPATSKDIQAAVEFSKQLEKRGYTKAAVTRVGGPKQSKGVGQ